MIANITEWTGRTGNNVIQLINCLYYAFYLHDFKKITFPQHPLFSTQTIISNNNSDDKKKTKEYKPIHSTFFYAKKLGFTLEPYQMREIAQTYLTNIVTVSIPTSVENNDNELYIHIRGGDTFNRGIMLLQNPLKLYTDILQDPSYDTYTRIIVVYEDTRNPVVQALQDIHNPRLHFQSSSIKTDIETLCRAKHLLMSLSTFSLLIYFLSSNIQHILLPEFMEQEWYPNMKWNVDKTLFTLEKYSISTWKYLNPYQKNQLLLHYKGTITKNKCMYVKKMHIISLGFVCYVKDLIKLTPYNKDTDIFDWMNNFYFSKTVDSLANGFNIFENIGLSTLEADTKKGSTMVLYNKEYDFRLPHEKEYFYNKQIIIDKYARRYNRFTQYKESLDNFLFIRLINVRGRYGKVKENIVSEYSKENYDKIQQYLPKYNKIMLFVDDILDSVIREKIYSKFIVVENIIHPGFVAGGTLFPYKNILLKKYNQFFKHCEKDFKHISDNIPTLNKYIDLQIFKKDM